MDGGGGPGGRDAPRSSFFAQLAKRDAPQRSSYFAQLAERGAERMYETYEMQRCRNVLLAGVATRFADLVARKQGADSSVEAPTEPVAPSKMNELETLA